MTATTTNKYAAPALEKGLDIIEYLSSVTSPQSQAEIAQGLGRGPNEIYRILIGLETRGYLLRDQISSKYKLSLKLYGLTRSLSPIDQLRQQAMPLMEELAVEIGQSCYLGVLYESKVMIIVQARPQSPISLSINEGSLLPTSATSPGKILLAHSRDTVRDMILERDERYLSFSASKKALFLKELQSIQENGHVSGESSIADGVIDCSVLVGRNQGEIIASLTVSSLSSKLSKQTQSETIIEKLNTTSNQIRQNLGL
ncbi:IclR family transcriptional regulator [Alginatibacterium sediminis]|uniref:IclR family transcriptional regulator n=1 Tax=Alginatibacterium sediminis TaxID=2164068 RepID=A0A420EBA0_9ALTE|nr:IclR family transcriptional regulator C-terminal domain-containing protein [Alginatibacterium sediminis]RKF17955.1 IclR family transcriptional regulator [Alginatibacterium sediminis]